MKIKGDNGDYLGSLWVATEMLLPRISRITRIYIMSDSRDKACLYPFYSLIFGFETYAIPVIREIRGNIF